MDAPQFLRALQLHDSFFPIGSFAYSDGLEAAVAHGLVADAEALAGWMRHYVEAVLPACDGPAVLGAAAAFGACDWEALIALDRELTALKPAASIRAGSRQLGRQLVTTWARLHPSPPLAALVGQIEAGHLAANLAVAHGAVCASAGLGAPEMLLGFAYGRLAGAASAALRLMAIGQQRAQEILTARLAELPAAVEAVVARGVRPPSSFSPALDVEQLTHRLVYSRLFRS
ncbi:MAG TPA: urease accessory UreF family protein [Vicinamibacterales bacterium]|nr:urease accessory UreF family protein [Vicinamibacterales bacterium]